MHLHSTTYFSCLSLAAACLRIVTDYNSDSELDTGSECLSKSSEAALLSQIASTDEVLFTAFSCQATDEFQGL